MCISGDNYGVFHLADKVTKDTTGLIELLICVDKGDHNSLWVDATTWRSLREAILTFAAQGRYSLLWPQSTTFEKSQRGYLSPEASTISFLSKEHKT